MLSSLLKSSKARTAVQAAGWIAALGTIGAVFQNCGRVSIVNGQNNSSGISAASVPATPVISLSENYVMTTLNQPVTVQIVTGLKNASLSFQQGANVTTTNLNGGVATVDPATQKLTFTPNLGFRGNLTTNLYSSLAGVTNIQTITFVVSNAVLNFNPALAIRGPQCLLCHAQVQGDLISDFGFKSATETGPDLFLTSNGGDSAFGISRNGSASLSTSTISGKLAIPNIDFTKLDPSVARSWLPLPSIAGGPAPTPVPAPFSIPNPDLGSSPITNLADFITDRQQLPANANFGGIEALNHIYIGAPLASDIVTAGQLNSSTPTNFFKNTETAPAISGLNHITTGHLNYYTNDGTTPIVCEGDLFVDGVVLLNNAQIQTVYGCRIYATHSVFIQGPITYPQVSALSNLEITSAIGVFMGFGYCIDCADAVSFSYQYKNSLAARLALIRSNGGVVSFRTLTYDGLTSAALADFALISDTPTTDTATTPPPTPPAGTINPDAFYAKYYAQSGLSVTQFDASNPVYDQSNTNYNRLLLNAPLVMSRYSGNYTGMVIAEFAMWRLGEFTFNFDSVFTGVPLLPFLKLSTILNIQ